MDFNFLFYIFLYEESRFHEHENIEEMQRSCRRNNVKYNRSKDRMIQSSKKSTMMTLRKLFKPNTILTQKQLRLQQIDTHIRGYASCWRNLILVRAANARLIVSNSRIARLPATNQSTISRSVAKRTWTPHSRALSWGSINFPVALESKSRVCKHCYKEKIREMQKISSPLREFTFFVVSIFLHSRIYYFSPPKEEIREEDRFSRESDINP